MFLAIGTIELTNPAPTSLVNSGMRGRLLCVAVEDILLFIQVDVDRDELIFWFNWAVLDCCVDVEDSAFLFLFVAGRVDEADIEVTFWESYVTVGMDDSGAGSVLVVG